MFHLIRPEPSNFAKKNGPNTIDMAQTWPKLGKRSRNSATNSGSLPKSQCSGRCPTTSSQHSPTLAETRPTSGEIDQPPRIVVELTELAPDPIESSPDLVQPGPIWPKPHRMGLNPGHVDQVHLNSVPSCRGRELRTGPALTIHEVSGSAEDPPGE